MVVAGVGILGVSWPPDQSTTFKLTMPFKGFLGISKRKTRNGFTIKACQGAAMMHSDQRQNDDRFEVVLKLCKMLFVKYNNHVISIHG